MNKKQKQKHLSSWSFKQRAHQQKWKMSWKRFARNEEIVCKNQILRQELKKAISTKKTQGTFLFPKYALCLGGLFDVIFCDSCLRKGLQITCSAQRRALGRVIPACPLLRPASAAAAAGRCQGFCGLARTCTSSASRSGIDFLAGHNIKVLYAHLW